MKSSIAAATVTVAGGGTTACCEVVVADLDVVGLQSYAIQRRYGGHAAS